MPSRSPDEDRTIFLALYVLEDAVRRMGRGGRLKPEPGVRLALAYLYSVSRPPRSRDAYDELWRVLLGTDVMSDGKLEFASTWADTQLAGIWRSVGVVQSIETTDAVSRAVSGETSGATAYRHHYADLVRRAGEDHRAERFAGIDANGCALDQPEGSADPHQQGDARLFVDWLSPFR